MRNQKNRFGCGNSNPYHRGMVVFMAYGADYRYLVRHYTDRRENAFVPDFIRAGNRGILAVLFSCPAKG